MAGHYATQNQLENDRKMTRNPKSTFWEGGRWWWGMNPGWAVAEKKTRTIHELLRQQRAIVATPLLESTPSPNSQLTPLNSGHGLR